MAVNPEEVLESIIADTDSPAIRALGDTLPLMFERTAAAEDRAAAISDRDAELVTINERWQSTISYADYRVRGNNERCGELWQQTGKAALAGFRAGEVSPEELIYVDGLLVSSDQQGLIFDYKHAAQNLARFRELVPGAPVVEYISSFWQKEPSDIRLIRAGILAEKPTVQVLHDESELFTKPSVLLTFEDGTTDKTDWHHKRAIGPIAVDHLVDAWVEEASGGETIQLLNDLVTLAPLHLDKNKLEKMRSKVLKSILDKGSTKHLLDALPAVLVVGGPQRFKEAVDKLAGIKSIDAAAELSEPVAVAMNPNYKTLAPADRYRALAAAAEFITGIATTE